MFFKNQKSRVEHDHYLQGNYEFTSFNDSNCYNMPERLNNNNSFPSQQPSPFMGYSQNIPENNTRINLRMPNRPSAMPRTREFNVEHNGKWRYRRHHLDDVFLPNYDEDTKSRQASGARRTVYSKIERAKNYYNPKRYQINHHKKPENVKNPRNVEVLIKKGAMKITEKSVTEKKDENDSKSEKTEEETNNCTLKKTSSSTTVVSMDLGTDEEKESSENELKIDETTANQVEESTLSNESNLKSESKLMNKPDLNKDIESRDNSKLQSELQVNKETKLGVDTKPSSKSVVQNEKKSPPYSLSQTEIPFLENLCNIKHVSIDFNANLKDPRLKSSYYNKQSRPMYCETFRYNQVENGSEIGRKLKKHRQNGRGSEITHQDWKKIRKNPSLCLNSVEILKWCQNKSQVKEFCCHAVIDPTEVQRYYSRHEKNAKSTDLLNLIDTTKSYLKMAETERKPRKSLTFEEFIKDNEEERRFLSQRAKNVRTVGTEKKPNQNRQKDKNKNKKPPRSPKFNELFGDDFSDDDFVNNKSIPKRRKSTCEEVERPKKIQKRRSTTTCADVDQSSSVHRTETIESIQNEILKGSNISFNANNEKNKTPVLFNDDDDILQILQESQISIIEDQVIEPETDKLKICQANQNVLSEIIWKETKKMKNFEFKLHKSDSKKIHEQNLTTHDISHEKNFEIIQPFIDLTNDIDDIINFRNVIITNVSTDESITNFDVKKEMDEEGDEIVLNIRVGAVEVKKEPEVAMKYAISMKVENELENDIEMCDDLSDQSCEKMYPKKPSVHPEELFRPISSRVEVAYPFQIKTIIPPPVLQQPVILNKNQDEKRVDVHPNTGMNVSSNSTNHRTAIPTSVNQESISRITWQRIESITPPAKVPQTRHIALQPDAGMNGISVSTNHRTIVPTSSNENIRTSAYQWPRIESITPPPPVPQSHLNKTQETNRIALQPGMNGNSISTNNCTVVPTSNNQEMNRMSAQQTQQTILNGTTSNESNITLTNILNSSRLNDAQLKTREIYEKFYINVCKIIETYYLIHHQYADMHRKLLETFEQNKNQYFTSQRETNTISQILNDRGCFYGFKLWLECSTLPDDYLLHFDFQQFLRFAPTYFRQTTYLSSVKVIVLYMSILMDPQAILYAQKDSTNYFKKKIDYICKLLNFESTGSCKNAPQNVNTQGNTITAKTTTQFYNNTQTNQDLIQSRNVTQTSVTQQLPPSYMNHMMKNSQNRHPYYVTSSTQQTYSTNSNNAQSNVPPVMYNATNQTTCVNRSAAQTNTNVNRQNMNLIISGNSSNYNQYQINQRGVIPNVQPTNQNTNIFYNNVTNPQVVKNVTLNAYAASTYQNSHQINLSSTHNVLANLLQHMPSHASNVKNSIQQSKNTEENRPLLRMLSGNNTGSDYMKSGAHERQFITSSVAISRDQQISCIQRTNQPSMNQQMGFSQKSIQQQCAIQKDQQSGFAQRNNQTSFNPRVNQQTGFTHQKVQESIIPRGQQSNFIQRTDQQSNKLDQQGSLRQQGVQQNCTPRDQYRGFGQMSNQPIAGSKVDHQNGLNRKEVQQSVISKDQQTNSVQKINQHSVISRQDQQRNLNQQAVYQNCSSREYQQKGPNHQEIQQNFSTSDQQCFSPRVNQLRDFRHREVQQVTTTKGQQSNFIQETNPTNISANVNQQRGVNQQGVQQRVISKDQQRDSIQGATTSVNPRGDLQKDSARQKIQQDVSTRDEQIGVIMRTIQNMVSPKVNQTVDFSRRDVQQDISTRDQQSDSQRDHPSVNLRVDQHKGPNQQEILQNVRNQQMGSSRKEILQNVPARDQQIGVIQSTNQRSVSPKVNQTIDFRHKEVQQDSLTIGQQSNIIQETNQTNVRPRDEQSCLNQKSNQPIVSPKMDQQRGFNGQTVQLDSILRDQQKDIPSVDQASARSKENAIVQSEVLQKNNTMELIDCPSIHIDIKKEVIQDDIIDLTWIDDLKKEDNTSTDDLQDEFLRVKVEALDHLHASVASPNNDSGTDSPTHIMSDDYEDVVSFEGTNHSYFFTY